MWPTAPALDTPIFSLPYLLPGKAPLTPLTRPQTSAVKGRSLMTRGLVGSERAGDGDLWAASGPGPPEPLGGSGLAAALFS